MWGCCWCWCWDSRWAELPDSGVEAALPIVGILQTRQHNSKDSIKGIGTIPGLFW